MILHIDTTKGDDIEIALKDKNKVLVKDKFAAKYTQAEKLLPGIEKLLGKDNINLANIKEIVVQNKAIDLTKKQKTGFTALRIGVVTANTIGYALNVPVKGLESNNYKKMANFSIIEPIYNKKPNITKKKQ